MNELTLDKSSNILLANVNRLNLSSNEAAVISNKKIVSAIEKKVEKTDNGDDWESFKLFLLI